LVITLMMLKATMHWRLVLSFWRTKARVVSMSLTKWAFVLLLLKGFDLFSNSTKRSSKQWSSSPSALPRLELSVACPPELPSWLLVGDLTFMTVAHIEANPVGGHYNKAKTVSENLKMGSALLSRFDLVFILLDKVCSKGYKPMLTFKADEEMDRILSDHVMAMHGGLPMEARSRVRITAQVDNRSHNSLILARWGSSTN
jgi:hypothetical protein